MSEEFLENVFNELLCVVEDMYVNDEFILENLLEVKINS